MTHTTLKPTDTLNARTSSRVIRTPATRPRWFTLGGILLGLLAVFVLTIAVGSVTIPLDDILRVLLGGEASKESWTNIIMKFRLPKAVTAMTAGAALGISGLLMQTFFRNPLAGPFILGISSGASLGAAVVVLGTGTAGAVVIAGVGLTGDALLVFGASVGAGATMFIVMMIARIVRNTMTLLILGLMFGYLTSALVSLLLFFSIPEKIQSYINWTFGTFGGMSWSQLGLMVPLVLVGLVMAAALAKSLNALLLGEQYAASMGLNVRRARLLIVLATAILAGTVTAFCGPIGFIGIAVPHLSRTLLNTSEHRVLVPATMMLGAIVALVAAIVAEVPGSTLILPLNAVTSLIGAPVVIWVIIRRQNRQKVTV